MEVHRRVLTGVRVEAGREVEVEMDDEVSVVLGWHGKSQVEGGIEYPDQRDVDISCRFREDGTELVTVRVKMPLVRCKNGPVPLESAGGRSHEEDTKQ